MKRHQYQTDLTWTGNRGEGTSTYSGYDRNYRIEIRNKPVLEGSSDSAFRGDPTRHNPEELFLSAISSCHMLWYLHLCAVNQVRVVSYTDRAEGTMVESADGAGYFEKVLLRPAVVITDESMVEKATELHRKANQMCFIANSLNFKVEHQSVITVDAK